MSFGTFAYPLPINEPVQQYAPNSLERAEILKAIAQLKKKPIDVPMYIGGKQVKTTVKGELRPPHETSFLLGTFSKGNASHVTAAIDAALKAKPAWEAMPWEQRAHIFLKAADLLATKYRYLINAATMLGQSKNAYQAEIDAACEFIDFLRFNVHFLSNIYTQQPISAPGMHNRMEWRALEGFVLAVTPFNFTAIAGNLPTSAAMCGNVVVWKPANTAIYSAQLLMRIFLEAGLPHGVINLIYTDGPTVGSVCLKHKDFAGVHFTGSTGVFNNMWKTIGENIGTYKTYPKVVGETGGKDFVIVHHSADVDVVATALARGAFEYQGQKCSAASRAYLPDNIAPKILEKLVNMVNSMQMGTVEDFGNFVNAVIDEKSFNNIKTYIEHAKKDPKCTIICGGTYDKTNGYFVAPTVIVTTNAKYKSLCEEIFGPVLTIYIYKANEFEQALKLVDETSPYALTGAIIAQDRAAVLQATNALRHAAGNFYINDKPTGAVVGQQPFGGARASGTNDKAGSALNLYRWLSARTIKETFNPPTTYEYPFLQS